MPIFNVINMFNLKSYLMKRDEFSAKMIELNVDAADVDRLVAIPGINGKTYAQYAKRIAESGDPINEVTAIIAESIPVDDNVFSIDRPERVLATGKIVSCKVQKAYKGSTASVVNEDGSVTLPTTDWQRTHYRLVLSVDNDVIVVIAGHRKMYQQTEEMLSDSEMSIDRKIINAVNGKNATLEFDVFKPGKIYQIEGSDTVKRPDVLERHLVDLSIGESEDQRRIEFIQKLMEISGGQLTPEIVELSKSI